MVCFLLYQNRMILVPFLLPSTISHYRVPANIVFRILPGGWFTWKRASVMYSHISYSISTINIRIIASIENSFWPGSPESKQGVPVWVLVTSTPAASDWAASPFPHRARMRSCPHGSVLLRGVHLFHWHAGMGTVLTWATSGSGDSFFESQSLFMSYHWRQHHYFFFEIMMAIFYFSQCSFSHAYVAKQKPFCSSFYFCLSGFLLLPFAFMLNCL